MHRNHPKHSNFEKGRFRYKIWAPDLRNYQKYPKKNGRFIAIYSIFLICMVYIWWYLVKPHVHRVQIMYSKGVRGCLRPSYGRPKLTLVWRFVATQLRCHKSKTIRQFWSAHLETNRTWTPILGLFVLFVSKQSNENWRSDFDLSHLWLFVTRPLFRLWPNFEPL